MVALSDAAKAVPYSPEWWLARLTKQLKAQAGYCREYDLFHEGEQPLAFASKKFAEIFGERYRRLPANFMPLVVDAEAERLAVQGFRFGGNVGDKAAWSIWQRNNMDAESQIAHEGALAVGTSFVMVVPGGGKAEMTIESPLEVALETSPGNRRKRLAALKVFMDDEHYFRAYLFLPDEIYKYRTSKPTQTDKTWSYDTGRYEPFSEPDETWPLPNAQGVVPIIPLLNRPKRNGEGRSEIAPVMGNQNAINKIRFDALVASEFVAFPQRWAINIDIPVDPDTGKPIAPFRPGVDNLWAARVPSPEEQQEYGTSGKPTPSFGQFAAADLKPYIDMEREEIGMMSSISRTPYHYLLGEPTSIPPSGESIKSSEAPLVKKVGRQSIHFGEGWEEAMRLALRIEGQGTKARADAETIWADPETRNEAARTDSVLKQHAAGLLPDEFALEELGYSQQQIERIMSIKKAEAVAAPAAPPPPPAPPAGGPTADNITPPLQNGSQPV